MVWGLSTALGNLDHAGDVLLAGLREDPRVLVRRYTEDAR